MRRLIVLSAALAALLGFSAGLHAADKGDDDTPNAKKTRALLQTKLDEVDFQDEAFGDVINDLKDKVPGLHIQTAKDGTIKLNHQCKFSAKDVTLAEALDKLLTSIDSTWGYIVISQKGNAYDGSIMIRTGKERGFPADKDK